MTMETRHGTEEVNILSTLISPTLPYQLVSSSLRPTLRQVRKDQGRSMHPHSWLVTGRTVIPDLARQFPGPC
ncbi:hypothetical protein E2C01_060943 [Portunus trituberculatus]|uniref:Uncharacterized protein n=1 Tax=Portunus trituberculatus TaxID=210409 RepID=A0A5B7H3Y4_PORTR|nr:hypothetical protein [Portunus trituberculatus]